MTRQRPSGRRARLLAPILAVLCLGAVPSASSQGIDSTLVTRYQLAESYLRAAQFDRAIALLEGLVERSPDTYVFFDKLREAYASVKRYDEAIALVESRIAPGEAGTPLRAEKARLQYLNGDEEGALVTWDEAIGQAPDRPGTYLVVYRSLMQMRLFEKAAEVLEYGRHELGNDQLFQTDLAYLYSLTGRHDDAAREYLSVLAQNERQITFVRGRLSQQIEQEDVMTASVAATEAAVRQDPLNRAFRELLGWLYLESGRYEEALDANRAIDRLENEQGRVLYAFAQQAADAGAYGAALEAYEEILDRYPDAPSAPEARQATGLLYERWADRAREAADPQADSLYSEAIAAYGRFLSAHPGHDLLPEVHFRLGRIQREVLQDLDAAEASYNLILERWPGYDTADHASFELARLAVLRNRMGEAQTRYARLSDRLRTGELAEAARFELALIHFYRGEFDAALGLTESMKENTAADVSNDAIALKVLLVENRGPDSLDAPLRGLASIRLASRQARYDEALSDLDGILNQLGNHPLLDDLSFERAALLASLGRPEEAVAAYKEFPLTHPDSHLADRSLFEAARIESEVLGRDDDATTTLNRLLTDYPGSLLGSEARDRIRLLRGDGT
ncbi:MAG: tetratricopeptide repeat protein [Rhodothermales bacterium]|nr:tetratricopeptide repeat protein [Rhodothermales bacterium]MBO6779811.1 tetratricopeptide repeat protein [Rhodothermales bacterium]